jgi:hypothetical protein
MDRIHNRFTASDLAVAVLTAACAVGAVFCVLSALRSI